MKKLSTAVLALAGALVSAAPALADTVSYNLTTVNSSVAPGGTVTFDGSIVAPSSNSGDISIISDDFSIPTGITLDDTDFFNDTPLALGPGQSYIGPLFIVTAASTDAPGVYLGTFDIEFGDASGDIFTDSAPFQVSVSPEPASWLLLGTGLAAAWLLRRRLLTRAATV